jgi:hypothetical protein
MLAAMHVLTDELVLKMVLQASRELSASFRWLSAEEAGSGAHTHTHTFTHTHTHISS